MPSHVHALPAAMHPYITSCVGYEFRLAPDAVHHGLPSTALTVIIAFDESLDCGWLDTGGHQRFWTLAAGLHTRPALIRTHGHQHGIQLGLTPLGARALLGVPAGALAHELVPHADLDTGVSEKLHARMAEADWPTRFALLEQHLGERLADARHARLSPEVAEAWRVATRTSGDVRVEALARHVGWSRRHLNDRFRHEIGVSPKQLIRLARFEQAQELVAAGRPLAQVAHACAYSDQPHLNREWKAFSGFTPGGLADNFPFVQDHEH